MIRGVNFLEVERFVITYKKMAVAFVFTLVVCLLFYVGQFVRQIYLAHEIDNLQKEVSELKVKQESSKAQLQSQLGTGPQAAVQALRSSLEGAIRWGSALTDLARRLPPQVWLHGIRNYVKADGAGRPAIVFEGYSQDIGSISLFVALLEKSPHFETVVLKNTTNEAGGEGNVFQFSIEAEVKGL